MKIKVGDKVKVLAGKDKGKEGKIVKILKKDNKVIVEGINMIKKHVKPNRMNEVGSIVDMEAPIHISNVKLATKDSKASSSDSKKVVKEAKETKNVAATKATKTTAKITTKKTEKKAS